jgi:hypothetical protein
VGQPLQRSNVPFPPRAFFLDADLKTLPATTLPPSCRIQMKTEAVPFMVNFPAIFLPAY